jgi:preprotein translocase subunit YajC
LAKPNLAEYGRFRYDGWGCPSRTPVEGSVHLFAFVFQLMTFAADQAADQDPNLIFRTMLPLVAIMALFYLMLIRPQKRKEKELREQVSSVKENDRVITIGGIYGVVTNVQRDAQRVTIRVDESNGTKLKLNLSAIARVLTAEDQETGAAATKTS